MNMRIAGLVNDSIVDGAGFRYSIFVQGCPHHCPGCHNPQTHDFHGGTDMDTDSIIENFSDNPLLDGITLSGGEPFCQCEGCMELAKAAKKLGLNVWAYTGYVYEKLLEMPEAVQLLQYVDVLVDGRFVPEQRTLEKRFRGSKNQRLIDVQASRAAGHAIEAEE